MSRDLRALFDPRSVAIVGASNDPTKWGYGLARGALRGSARRDVYLVNRSGGEVLGPYGVSDRSTSCPSRRSSSWSRFRQQGFEEAVDGALAAGAKRARRRSRRASGRRATEGRAREPAIVERVRAARRGAARAELPRGLRRRRRAGHRLERASGGSDRPHLAERQPRARARTARDETTASASRVSSRSATRPTSRPPSSSTAFAEHEPTRVIALYLEDFRDGRAFASACHAAAAAGKPVVLLAAGRSDAASRAARSHTGALVSDFVAVQAACRAAGIEQVSTPTEMIDTAQALLVRNLPRGHRVVVFGDGGGHGVIAADLAAASGLASSRSSATRWSTRWPRCSARRQRPGTPWTSRARASRRSFASRT